MGYLTKRQVEKFIESMVNGAIFSVVFEKKDGTLRRMVCKQGVTKHLKGGEATYNGKEGDGDNIGVFDTEAGEYRCFNATRVLRVKGGGATIQAGELPDDEAILNAKGEPVKVK